MMKLPENHDQRYVLSNEVHARPPEPLEGAVKLSCIALTTNWPYADADREIVAAITRRYGATPPGPGVKHYSVDLKDFRLIWERHTEFTRYTFIVNAKQGAAPFSATAIEAAPADWVASLPGELIVATHAALVPASDDTPLSHGELSAQHFSGNALIGAAIAGGAATCVTDFRLHADGFSRFLVLNRSMTSWHAGRIVQRLLEIETYRIMALLALPVAQNLAPELTSWESELSGVVTEMTASGADDEARLLDRLTALQAAIEKSHTETQFRFGAAAAYYALVQRRILELREDRLSDMQMFSEFTERRLAPAMDTCQSASRRQAALSERVDRAAQLLSAKVDKALQIQNRQILESMNKRAELQLRLQQTVEGLSVAAVTYYIVGVVGYFAGGLAGIGIHIDPKFAMGLAAPLALALAIAGVWHTRHQLEKREKAQAPEP
ncbi:DUF3422 domain-containing protein [Hyphomonas sp.]|uniref:DUF3422 family protein n=1 Tax=Hyphomonas sp. TaxID=87 RepID=UPI0025B9B005|nr:DUF3422 domain-containing protein [Hyphomonas sp.]MBI1400631.1 DUF3422 family protein [Hyphomonas sp.]